MTRFILFAVALGFVVGLAPAHGQSPLESPALFAHVAGLNTVPDHGDAAVSFLDYRNGGYSIMVVDLASSAEHELERVFYAEPEVATFGERVAWIGYTASGQPDVYVHDRTIGTTTQVTTDAAFQNHPDLSATVLVWQDYRHSDAEGSNADIYLYDFASASMTPVTTDAAYQDLPRIHGDRVVWQDFRHAGSLLETADIYAFDINTQQERRLTAGSVYRTHPAIWGDLVVWEDYRGSSNGDIYLYDLAADREIPITTNEAHQGQPIVYGDWVLWLDYRNSVEQGDLYGYHLKTEQEYPLLVHPAHQDAPHMYGDQVVWQDYRNARFDLYAGRLVEPTHTAAEEETPQQSFRLTAAPNPSASSVTFRLEHAPTRPLEFAIYDILGRRVVHKHLSSRETAVAWDGRGDTGRPVGPGPYVAVVRGPGILQRIVIVRPL